MIILMFGLCMLCVEMYWCVVLRIMLMFFGCSMLNSVLVICMVIFFWICRCFVNVLMRCVSFEMLMM